MKSITATKLLFMYRNQRRLLRGCREIQHCECSPLKNFPPDEVLGFEKDSGAAGGGGKIGVNGKPQKGSFDDALAGATMLDEFLSETKFIWDYGEESVAEREHKQQQPSERMREMFDIKPFNEQLLSGCVFDTNGTEPANALVNGLQRQGDIFILAPP